MEIRAAAASDIATIQQIAHATWPTAYGKILSAQQLEYMLGLMYNHETLLGQMQSGHCFFVAEASGRPIGFAGISPTEIPGRWKLQKLYVLPTTQQKGTGKMLLAFVEHFAATQKAAAKMCLQVNRANIAKGFYEKMGYTIESVADIDIGNGYFMNDYVMVKQLLQ